MTRELTQKKTVFNSRTAFCKQMRLPFNQAMKFWKYSDKETKRLFLDDDERDTAHGSGKRDELEKKANSYDLTGPLGSQDPQLPVSTKLLKQKLNDPRSGLAVAWEKRNIQKRNDTLTSAIEGC